MSKRVIELILRLSRQSGLAGVVLFSPIRQGAQPPADSGGSYAGIVLAIAVLGPIILGLIAAAVMWVLSRSAPAATIGVEPPRPAQPREVLPPGVHLPSPSIRPLIIAVGLTLISFGVIVRNIAISLSPDFNIPIVVVVGVLIMAAGLFGWVRDDWRAAGRH
jgi:hypothetical protein